MSGCHDEHKKAHPSPTCLVTNPIRQDVELSKGYVAQIHAIQHIELRALERGYLQGISVDEGQSVKKGTLMFQIMPMLYQAEVQKAAADTQLTELEYKNTKILADQDIVSTNELALAQAKFSRAKAELSLATTHNALTSVRAPFDGMMGRFEVRLGSLVEEGSLLTTLADNSTVWVYFNVSEAEYLDYKSDKLRSGSHGAPQEVKLLMANGKRFEHVGRVETIEADFNNETGNIAFRATFPNASGLLRHGETGKILMTVPNKDVLVIPQMATFEVLDKRFVFVVDEKNVVHSRAITIAHELPQLFIVQSGLSETDRIVVDGLRKVRDGDVVAVKYQQPREVLAHLEFAAQ